MYFSCSDIFSIIGISDLVMNRGYKAILKVLNTGASVNTENTHCLFISFSGAKWMRQDALEVFLCDKRSFKKYNTQKAAVLEQITKLRKKQKSSKVCRKLQSDYPSEPPSKKARHSPGHVDSSSSGARDMSIDGSDDNGSDVCTENSLSSGGQVQLPKVEGWVQFFDKQIQYTIQSGKVFLPVIDIPLVKNYTDKKGYSKLYEIFQKSGMDPTAYFIVFRMGKHQHRLVSVIGVLHILQNLNLGDKSQRQQLSSELPLVLERIVVHDIQNTMVKQQPNDLGTLLQGTYGNSAARFVKDLSKIIGKAKENFTLNKEDFVTLLTDNLSNARKKNFSEVVKTSYQILHPVSPKDTIHISDNFKGYRLLNELRKIVPGVLPSQNDEKLTRRDYIKSFNACLLPLRTSTGWQVNVARLLDVLKFKYPYITGEMIIRLTGDGREFGGRHSTFVAVNVLNDELLHHGVSHQSPKECFPVALFYEGDSRDNLEENLTSPTNKINEFLATTSAKSQYGVYFAADEMFTEACLDSSGTLSPKSATDWNIYGTNNADQKDEVADSGLRTDLPPLFDRKHPDSIFSNIEVEKVVPCVLHGGARVVEKLLNVELETIVADPNKVAERGSGPHLTAEDLVRNLENNIRQRGVKSGNFKIEINDKTKKLEPVKLNKDGAFAIISPSLDNSQYPHVLHNVLSSESQIHLEMPQPVLDYLQLPASLSELDYISLMWSSFHFMFSLLKSEPNIPTDSTTAPVQVGGNSPGCAAAAVEIAETDSNLHAHHWHYTDDQKKNTNFMQKDSISSIDIGTHTSV